MCLCGRKLYSDRVPNVMVIAHHAQDEPWFAMLSVMHLLWHYEYCMRVMRSVTSLTPFRRVDIFGDVWRCS